MSQRLIFMTIAFMVALTAFSEKGVITKEANMMCDSDEIVLQGLCYFHAGEQGTGVLWDFSGLQGNDGCMTVRHYKDSLNHNVRIDGKSARYYSFVGDTLLLAGSETPLSRTDYERGLLAMRYPMAYGDSVSSAFSAHGIYCGDHYFRERGSSAVMADASGSIVLGGDTVRNVLRVYSLRSYSICMDIDSAALDTTGLKQVIEERYDWYARGYRYPLFTTVTSTSYDNAIPVGTTQKAYCMLPDIQRLHDDPYNSDVRKSDSIEGARNRQREDIFHYSVKQSGGTVTIEYSLDADADITALVSDVMGVTYKRSHRRSVSGVGNTMTMDCSGLRYGQYILYMNVNGKIYSNNITIRP